MPTRRPIRCALVGNAYYNLGIALAGAGWYDDAKESINLYLLTNPSKDDKDQAQQKIYEFDAQKALQEKRYEEMKAKYGERSGGGFGLDALFRYGAVVQDMSFDASGNARTISLKIATRKENGLLRNYLTIYDITSQSDAFGQKFSMDWRGTNTFYLDDRGPNKDLMTLTVTSYGEGMPILPSDQQTTLLPLLRQASRPAQGTCQAGSICRL